MFVQLSGARSFTQQQWTVSCRGTAPHKKPFVRWMFGIKDGKSQNGVWVFFFFLHQGHLKFPKTTQKYITTTQGVWETHEVSCLLPRKHKLRHATVYQNPKSTPPSQDRQQSSPHRCVVLLKSKQGFKRLLFRFRSCYPTISFANYCKTTYLVALSEYFSSWKYYK